MNGKARYLKERKLMLMYLLINVRKEIDRLFVNKVISKNKRNKLIKVLLYFWDVYYNRYFPVSEDFKKAYNLLSDIK